MKSPSSRLEDLYADTGGAYHFGIESQVTEEEVFKAENDESLNSEPQSVQYCHHRSSSSTSTSNHHRPPHPTYTAAATNGNTSPLPGSAPISSFHRHQTPPHGGGYMIHPPPPPPGPPHAMSHMNHAPPHQHQPHPLVSIHPSASMEDVHEAVALHAAASRDGGGGGGSSPDTIPTRPSSALSNSSKQKRKKSMAIPEDCSSDPAPVSVPGSGSVPAIQYASYPPPPPHHFAPYPYYPPPPYAIPVYYPAGMPPPGPPHAPRHPHHHYPSAFPSVSSDFSRDEQPHSSTTPTQETNRTKHKEEAVENVERDEQHQQHHQHQHQQQHPPGHENEESAYNALKLSKSKSFEQRQKDNMIRAKLKEISQKPQNQKTPQDLVFFKKYEYKRQRKNERGRARTREDKKRMERIEAINPHLRSKEDAEWYDAKMLAKRRKNLMDRQRRQRLKINKTNSMTSTSSSTYGGGQQNEDSANDIAPQVIQYSNTYTSVESNGNGDEQSLSHLESYNSMGGGDGDDESSVCPKMMLSFLETLNKVNEPEHHGTDIGVGSPTRATNAATMAAAATAASTTTTSNSKWDNQQQQSRDTSRSSIFRNLH